ncbi:hypothetical protein [Spirosoma flavum]|uniref:DUF4595 domain-containing protein n=1 Tax=Spirosoma flavum TaxID=2048557 RepID=A0ABW6AHS8_9BACT
MNNLSKKSAMGAFLALSLNLVACKENSLVTPDQPLTEATKVVNDISPNLPKKYTLTKRGAANLTYYSDGRLKRVMYGPDVRGNTNTRTEYTYGAGSINAISYVGNNLLADQTYLIDETTGRCTEYKGLQYLYSNSSQTEKTELVYQYNTKGQLKTASDKANAAIRTEYTYNVDGDMIRAIHYGMNYSTLAISVQSDFTFAYDQPTGDPVLADLSPINVDETGFPDPFLKVFGKTSKHLVKLIMEKSTPGGSYFTYTLNADGYAMERKKYSLFNAASIETIPFNYLVTNLGFTTL